MGEKVTREAFIYLAPKKRDDVDMFAQCGSCRMFVPFVEHFKGSRCIIHGSKKVVDEDDSCGFYVDWPTPDGKPNAQVVSDHAKELAKNIQGSVTPAESGFVDDRVQCHRCEWFDARKTKCRLYDELTETLPEMFDCDPAVEKNACCNAWTDPGEDTDEKKTRPEALYTHPRSKK